MTYINRINALKVKLEEMGSPARLNLPFEPGRPPTQAFSEFLTNKEQGDWAELTFINNFNRTQKNFWAVKYGRSEDLIAGEPGFDLYYKNYQDELCRIGKRPDVLIFDREYFLGQRGCIYDISKLSSAELDELTLKAKYAIEVRSSAFISKDYDDFVSGVKESCKDAIDSYAKDLLKNYKKELGLLNGWEDFCKNWLNGGSNLSAPRAGSKRSTASLAKASDLTKEIKASLRTIRLRDFLSFTPKAEDLSLVYRWIEKFGVPHYYCQVFFDRAILLSFEEILNVLSMPEREGVDYFIEADEKNQRKVVFKINIALGQEVMSNVAIPEHFSDIKMLPKGRLLFYVRFKVSTAEVNNVSFNSC